jgi:hypothetical protein
MEVTPRKLEQVLDATRPLFKCIDPLSGPLREAHALAVQAQSSLIHYGESQGWYVYPGADNHWHVIILQEGKHD